MKGFLLGTGIPVLRESQNGLGWDRGCVLMPSQFNGLDFPQGEEEDNVQPGIWDKRIVLLGKSHREKPVSMKETEESCKFIRINGERPLGHIPAGFSLPRFQRQAEKVKYIKKVFIVTLRVGSSLVKMDLDETGQVWKINSRITQELWLEGT